MVGGGFAGVSLCFWFLACQHDGYPGVRDTIPSFAGSREGQPGTSSGRLAPSSSASRALKAASRCQTRLFVSLWSNGNRGLREESGNSGGVAWIGLPM
jgi:hypothetical protein